MNIKPLIDAVEILEEAKLVTIDEKDRLEIGHAIFKVRCVLQKRGVFLGGAEKPESTTDQTASAVNKARMDKEAADWREATEMAEAWCQTKDPYRRDREVYCYRAGYLKSMREADKKPEPPVTFIPKPPSPEIQEMWAKINEATARVVRENNLRIEELTEAQCAQAIIQAFQCGDFKRLVRVSDNAQQVIYTPFAECEALRSVAKELGETLGNVQDALDSYWREQPDTVCAVQAAVADANKFRIQLSRARQALLECNRDDLASVREALEL